jgi:hypothetical protein
VTAPFIQVISKRAEQFTDQELQEQAFSRLSQWAMISSGKHVSLDEVAWVGALLYKALKNTGLFPMRHIERRDETGARVVEVTASDGVRMSDGAG